MTSRGSLVNIMTRLQARRPGVRILAGQDIIYLFSTMSRPALGPTPTPVRWVPGTVSSGGSGRGVRPTIYLQLVLRCFCICTPSVNLHGVYGSVTALPLYTFMVCIGALPFIEIRVTEVRRKLYNEAHPLNCDVLLTVHLSTFILVINQLDAQNLFYNKFISCLYMFRAPCAHRQEVKIVLYSIWYHHTL